MPRVEICSEQLVDKMLEGVKAASQTGVIANYLLMDFRKKSRELIKQPPHFVAESPPGESVGSKLQEGNLQGKLFLIRHHFH